MAGKAESKVCVVTGASSGIGEATARALSGAGATVVLAARRKDRLRALADELTGQVLVVPCDVTVKKQVAALQDEVDKAFGRCDVLVNNAGIPGGGAFPDLSLQQIDRVVTTNLLSVMWVTKAFLPLLAASRGHVVNVASLAGRYALPGVSVYSGTKHAVIGFSEALYYELAPMGIMVTTVNPGVVATEGFLPRDSDLNRDRLVRAVTLQPERVAAVILDVVRRRRGPEVSVPRWLASFQALRLLTPGLFRGTLRRLVGDRARRAGG